MVNPKLVKVNTAIKKTKEKIEEYQAKLKDLERQKIRLENEEVVAMFRREKMNEDEFAALLQNGRQKQDESSRYETRLDSLPERKGDEDDANSEG